MTKERMKEIANEVKRKANIGLSDIYDGRYNDDEIEFYLTMRARENVKYTNM